MIDTILFDLDGTLLPMDNDIFTKSYFKGLAAELIPFGYDAGTLVDAVWHGGHGEKRRRPPELRGLLADV